MGWHPVAAVRLHSHTNSTQNTKNETYIAITKCEVWSAGRAPSVRVIPWHLPHNWGKREEEEGEHGVLVEWYWQRKNEILGEKPVSLPQISHGLTRDRSRESVVRSRRITAWVMARPGRLISNYKASVATSQGRQFVFVHEYKSLSAVYGSNQCCFCELNETY